MKLPQKVPAVRCYAAGNNGVHAVSREEAVRQIRAMHGRNEGQGDGTWIWIDVVSPGEAEAELLRDELGMHPLAVEDCLRGRQRPKVDRYTGYFFIVFFAAAINLERARMALNEVHLFLGTRFLITVHDNDVPEIGRVVSSWKLNPGRVNDTAAAAHALLDTFVDGYFPVIEHFSDRLETIEESTFNRAPESMLQQAIVLRHEMIIMRRILAPERDVLSSLVRHDLPFLRPELVPYFQDVYDHVLRITEEIDAFRDLLTGLVEVQSSNASNQLNRTMQTLTAWSIILMSVAVVAGVYGMNFTIMPELELTWGYYAALGLMAAIGLSLVLFFRRRGWL